MGIFTEIGEKLLKKEKLASIIVFFYLKKLCLGIKRTLISNGRKEDINSSAGVQWL